MPELTTPRPASTVVIMRPGTRGVEILMLRRPLKMATFAGAWVFPGGKLDAADSSARATARLMVADNDAPFRDVRDYSGRLIDVGDARAFWCAACRETFEESGILVAERPDGRACDRAQLAALRKARPAILADGEQFYAALEARDLIIPVRALIHWSHWITPSISTLRFDTHFFLAMVNQGTRAAPDTRESAVAQWRPLATLARVARAVPPQLLGPTAITLIDLENALNTDGGLAGLGRISRERHDVPLVPKVLEEGGHGWAVMPWDPDYERLPGEGRAVPLTQQAQFANLPARLPLPVTWRPPG
jgi:8-oxo-dGTP pyrophosphatase MutT (NUDIX family)